MFGIGGPELVLIVIVALLFVGPDKLPQVARTVGTGLRDLRRAANLAQAELRETLDDLAREVDRPIAPAAEPWSPPSQAQLDAQQAAEDRAAARTAEMANAAPLEPLPEPVFDGPPAEGETFAVIPRRTATEAPPAPGPSADEPGLAEALAEAMPAGTRPRSASPLRSGSLAAEAALVAEAAASVEAALGAEVARTAAKAAADPEQDA